MDAVPHFRYKELVIRRYTPLDHVIMQVNNGLSTLFLDLIANRPNPAKGLEEPKLSPNEKKDSIGYMRVNHTGEVCAQALYNGQSVIAHNDKTRAMLEKASAEEIDHLAWCHDRLKELGGRRSYLNVFWYGNSYLMGIIAGLAGDKWSLGFVEETEKQVEAHLDGHLNKISPKDTKSQKIVTQMKMDEIQHSQAAKKAGAVKLPRVIKKLMTFHAKVMTATVYWI